MAGQSSMSTAQFDLLCMLLNEDAEPKALPLPLLTEITDGFSDTRKIGSGGFAVVYKGVLEDSAVAVKRLSNTYMYEKEFLREVECLMKVRHKNIVRFLGYCVDIQGNVASNNDGEFIIADVQQKLLCFEYVPKGSLSDYIKDASVGLDWRTRYQIIKSVCEGLQYLHEINIVHLDLKPANVLLDEKMRPKITDFGLSRCFKDDQTRWETRNMAGTLGYISPEFYSGHTITYKFDLYSLGVMITEIITGMKGYQDVDQVVASWSDRCDTSQLEQIRVCMEIGFECSDFNPGKRPESMKHIVDRLAETESWQVIFPGGAEGVSSEILSFRPLELCFPFKKANSTKCQLHLTNTTDEFVAFKLEHKFYHGRRSLLSEKGHGIAPPRSTYTLVLLTTCGQEQEKKGIDHLVLSSTIFPHQQIGTSQKQRDRYFEAEFSESNSVKHKVALKALCTPPQGMRISPGIEAIRCKEHSCSLDTDQAKQWVVIGRSERAVIMDIDNVNNYQEEYTDDYNEPQLTGEATCKVIPAGSSSQLEIPDLHPLETYLFRFEDGLWSLNLTNKTDEHVAFSLLSEESFDHTLPLTGLYGIVPPKSTCTLLLPLEMLGDRMDFELKLRSSISGDRYTFLFADRLECHTFFANEKSSGYTVHEMSLKGDTTPAEPVISPGVKITSEKTDWCDNPVYSMDAHPTEPWTITSHRDGKIYRWNYYSPSIATDHDNKKPEGLRSIAMLKNIPEVRTAKIIARKRWIVAGAPDGVVHVYDYRGSGQDDMEKITTFRAANFYSVVTFLAVHPTQPYVVLTKQPRNLVTKHSWKYHDDLEVWGWDKGGWECTQTSGVDGDMISIVSAAHHGPGEDRVRCLHYFTRDDRQYLITGSQGCTAKIWDLQKKACIHTMAREAIMSPVISVLSLLPHRPYLLTGTENGTLQVWSSTDFRLKRTVNFGRGEAVRGLACLMGSPRVVVSQEKGLSIMEID